MKKRTKQLIKAIKRAFTPGYSIQYVIKYYLNPLREHSNLELVDKINELSNAIRELQNIQDSSLKGFDNRIKNNCGIKSERPFKE